MRRSGMLFAAALLAVGTPLAGQSVRGTVVGESGEGVRGATVLLTTAEGQRVRATLSGEGGRFRLHAAGPGAYRLRAERVGFAGVSSPLLTLGPGQVLEQILILPTEALTLEGLTAMGRRRCTLRPETGRETARVWDEARKALDATALAQSDSVLWFDLARYRRVLDVASLHVVSEELERRSGHWARPFQSLPAKSLVENGFVQETDSGAVYYGPDAEVLLSDAFLDTHCMRVVEGGEGERDLIGLAFEPVRGRKLPDIRGTLWLDRRTAELRSLEYRYTGLPRSVSHDHLGGSIEFRRLGSGLWVVDRWSIRMPQVEQVRIAPSRAAGVETPARTETRVRAIREEAGEIVSVRPVDRSSVRLAGGSGEPRTQATSTGLVRHGSGAPLPAGRANEAGAIPFGEVIELQGVTVEARARANSAHLGGFYERRQRERGHFVTREEFMARNPTHLADIVRVMPGVRVRSTPSGLGTTVQMQRAAPGLNASGSCPVTVYLNGIIHDLTYRGLDEIPTHDVAAVEVYPGASQIPARFNGRGSRCGVLVIWTRSRSG